MLAGAKRKWKSGHRGQRGAEKKGREQQELPSAKTDDTGDGAGLRLLPLLDGSLLVAK